MADRSRWLVSTEWLAAHLADSNLVILDGSWHLPASGRHGSSALLDQSSGHEEYWTAVEAFLASLK